MNFGIALIKILESWICT